MEMEVEIDKLSDFMKNCCRVCLSVENEMVDSSNIVENFNKTIDQLLFECTNLKLTNDISYPTQLCEDCTTELVMVAKFLEKCSISSVALEQLKRQIGKLRKSSSRTKQVPAQTNLTNITTDSKDTNTELYYENFDYCEENVEYVIYDSAQDIIEEADISDKSDDLAQDIIEEADISNKSDEAIETDAVDSYVTDHQNVGNLSTDEPISPRTSSRRETLASTRKMKQINETEIGLSTKAVIKYHCKICGAGFAQTNNFTRHLQTHNDYENEINQDMNEDHAPFEIENNIEVSTEDFGEQQNVIPAAKPIEPKHKKIMQKNHICQHCGRAFPSVSLLVTHNRTHTNERPYICNTCTKSFKTQGALDLHDRRHKGVKNYKCTVCTKSFVESSNLKVHMRTHTGEKPHSCVTCGRKFSRVFLLQIHQRTHTGEKPFVCETCDKSFAQQGDLAAHKRIHSGERPHVCNICGKGFIKSSGLTQHMRRHFRISNSNSSSSVENNVLEENVRIEMIDIQPNIRVVDSKPKQISISYKEYNEHSESFHDYLEN